MNDTPDGTTGFPLFVDDRHDLPLQLHYELDDRPLSVWAFRVYAHFVRRGGKNGRIYPTYNSIAETCFRSTFPEAKPETLKRRAMEAVKELEGQGLVRVVRSRAADGDDRHRSCRQPADDGCAPCARESDGCVRSPARPPAAR